MTRVACWNKTPSLDKVENILPCLPCKLQEGLKTDVLSATWHLLQEHTTRVIEVLFFISKLCSSLCFRCLIIFCHFILASSKNALYQRSKSSQFLCGKKITELHSYNNTVVLKFRDSLSKLDIVFSLCMHNCNTKIHKTQPFTAGIISNTSTNSRNFWLSTTKCIYVILVCSITTGLPVFFWTILIFSFLK